MTGLNTLELPPAAARELETLALRAWPARVVEPLGGWRLAFTDGFTRRLNSVQALDWDADVDLAAAIDRVEAFYAGHGLPARFRLTALSRPAGLDQVLATRGYTVEAPTDVMVADPPLTILPDPAADVALTDTPSPAWLDLFAAGEHAASRRALLDRMAAGTVFGTIRLDGRVVGLGLLVIDGASAGIFAMQVQPPHRRRGLATGLLQAFAAEARRQGAGRLYLQVEQDNPAARALYLRASFRLAYGYHYRQQPRP